MNKLSLLSVGLVAALAAAGCSTTPADTGGPSSVAERGSPDLDCKMSFSLTGWAALYKHAEGVGTVTCENGQSLPVSITVKGGGLTAGKWHVDNGKGTFTDVHRIGDVLGRYVQGGAHAGIVKSGSAQVLTKGTVSLALARNGDGIDLGVGVGSLTKRRR
jgi:hypothetical protein